ncbi:hypothetical protein M9H77_02515 [Catharanthus roseus]|uniref:Uncharacterized protein n=1 Tax=Catharanthus roseus TaxID=4058 RepID=A0ACC0C912_CATRO|nr:hypothetical protein M9H77_02515 [Catharanthus roseus]
MEVRSKQKDYQSKLSSDMHNYYHGSGNRFNSFGENNHGIGNFTSRRHVGDGKLSSYAKSFEHTSYDDYGGYGRVNTRYDNYEHSPYDYYEKNMDINSIFSASLGTLLEKKQFIELNSISCAIPRVDEYYFNIANYVSYVLGIEDK